MNPARRRDKTVVISITAAGIAVLAVLIWVILPTFEATQAATTAPSGSASGEAAAAELDAARLSGASIGSYQLTVVERVRRHAVNFLLVGDNTQRCHVSGQRDKMDCAALDAPVEVHFGPHGERSVNIDYAFAHERSEPWLVLEDVYRKSWPGANQVLVQEDKNIVSVFPTGQAWVSSEGWVFALNPVTHSRGDVVRLSSDQPDLSIGWSTPEMPDATGALFGAFVIWRALATGQVFVNRLRDADPHGEMNGGETQLPPAIQLYVGELPNRHCAYFSATEAAQLRVAHVRKGGVDVAIERDRKWKHVSGRPSFLESDALVDEAQLSCARYGAFITHVSVTKPKRDVISCHENPSQPGCSHDVALKQMQCNMGGCAEAQPRQVRSPTEVSSARLVNLRGTWVLLWTTDHKKLHTVVGVWDELERERVRTLLEGVTLIDVVARDDEAVVLVMRTDGHVGAIVIDHEGAVKPVTR